MFLNALLVAIVTLLSDVSECFLSNGMLKRPIIVGTFVGLLLGDVSTGAIVGGQLELIFMGVASIGGIHSTEPHMAAAFASAICILFGYSWKEAIVLAVPVGYIGIILGNVYQIFKSLMIPVLDKLIEEDKLKQFSALFLAIPWICSLLPAIAMFSGIYAGADVLEKLINSLPEFLSVGMNAASCMLPAVGMGLLLNFIWDSKLSIYFILGFALSSFLGVSNIFVAIVGVFLAYLEMNRFMERGKISSEVSASNNNIAEEDFFNE